MKRNNESMGSVFLPLRPLLVCLILFFLQVPLSGDERLAWESDLDSALKKAAHRGKPMLISMHTSTETACVRMLNVVFGDRTVRTRLKDFVLLPTCMDEHAEVVADVDGTERSVSVLFGTVDCKTLVANEKAVRARFFNSSVVKVPQHLFVDVQPDGEWRIVEQKVYELSKSRFVDLLEEVLVVHGALRVGGLPDHLKDLFETVRKGALSKINSIESVRGD